jgi:hypothetical protein
MSANAPARSRLAATRRALVGAAWALAWMLVWGSALLMFAHRAQAAPRTLALSSGPVPLPIDAAGGGLVP